MKIACFAAILLALFFQPVFAEGSEQFPKVFVSIIAADSIPANPNKKPTWYAVLDVLSLQKTQRVRCELDSGKYLYAAELQPLKDGRVGVLAGQLVKGMNRGFTSLFSGSVGAEEILFAVVLPSYYEMRVRQIEDSNSLAWELSIAKEKGYNNLSCGVASDKASP